ncbi:MAG: mannitol-1-phosphate 5-dehydrogenase, partial [Lachnospiraceae bacterium]|nr:mannitol-1-phosphate 5-dehydrogenase [Lachnospiraceae bacterium]
VGVTEAVIMRSAIEADQELLKVCPLAVNVQDFWTLPVDASRIKGKLPDIMGLSLISEFSGFLERKFYTYNAANGTVSYLGALMGYKKIADAAHDKKIIEILDGVYQETAMALSRK